MVRVDPEKFRQAADNFDTISSQAFSFGAAARGSLTGFDGMAGTDPGGEQFAEAYDQMATAALQGFFDAGTSARDIDRGLMASAATHAQANANAGYITYDAAAAYVQRPKVDGMTVVPPPSAFGGRPDTVVDGLDSAAVWVWDQILNLVGMMYPDGDPEKLRAAGSAWQGILSDLRSLSTSISSADSPLAAVESGEIAAISSKVDKFSEGLKDFISDGEGGIGQIDNICKDYADQIEETQRETKQMLTQLVIEIVAGAAIGGLLSVVTFGASAAVAGGAIAARIAAVAVRIGTLIEKCLQAAMRLSKTLRAIVLALRTAGTKFPRLTRITIDVASGVGGASAAEIVDPSSNFAAASAGGGVGGGTTALITSVFGKGATKFTVRALANATGGVAGTAVDMGLRGEEITPAALAVSAGLGVAMSGKFPSRKGADAANPKGGGDTGGGRTDVPDANIPAGVGGDASSSSPDGGGGVKTDNEAPAGAGGEISGSGGDGGSAPTDHGEAPSEVEIVVTPEPRDVDGSADGQGSDSNGPGAGDSSADDAVHDSAPDADSGSADSNSSGEQGFDDAPKGDGGSDAEKPPVFDDDGSSITPDSTLDADPTPDADSTPDAGTKPDADSTRGGDSEPDADAGAATSGGTPHGAAGEPDGPRRPRDDEAADGGSRDDDADSADDDGTDGGDRADATDDASDPDASPEDDAASSSGSRSDTLFDADGRRLSFDEWDAAHGDPDAPLAQRKGEYDELSAQQNMENEGWHRVDSDAENSQSADADDSGATPPADGSGSATDSGATPPTPPRSSDDVVNEYLASRGIDPFEVHALRVRDTGYLSAEQLQLLKDIRDAVPMVDGSTPMVKVIPFSDIEKYIDGSYTAGDAASGYEAQVGGFMLRESDIDTNVPLAQIVKDLRLDYTPEKGRINEFTQKGSTAYGFLRFTPSVPSRIEVPFGPDIQPGSTHTHDAPFTGNGMLKNPDTVFRPEYYATTRMGLENGTELWINENGVPTLVAVFDSLHGFVRVS